MEKRTVILDSECDSLFPTTIHCIVLKDIKTNEVFKFVQSECFSSFPSFYKEQIGHIIGHNLIEFDIPKVLNKLLNLNVDIKDCTDTYVLSRLAYSDRYDKDVEKAKGEENIPTKYRMILRDKSHSLAAWGIRVGRYKPDIQDWSVYTPEMLNRCSEDVEINHLVYKILQQELKSFSLYSQRLEHRVAEIIAEQCKHGLQLDVVKAQALHDECKEYALQVKEEICREVPPSVIILEKNVVPKYTKLKLKTGKKVRSEKTGRLVDETIETEVISPQNKGYKYITEAGFSIRGAYSVIAFEPFNPDSSKQRLEALERSGWNPVNFNKPTDPMLAKGMTKGNPKTTDEENLATIPDTAPQGIKKLGDYIMFTNRYKLAEQWMTLMDNKGRVHGYVDSCGTPTGRMRHNSPNLANVVSVQVVDKFSPEEKDKLLSLNIENFERIPQGYPYEGHLIHKHDDKVKVILTGKEGMYGYECRDCWTVANKNTHDLVGVDAASLELRMLAHYMNDPAYTQEVISGDIHARNQKLAGLSTRAQAKTFIYGFLYGAGDEKVGTIVNGTKAQGRRLKETFLNNLPSLKTVINQIQKDGKKGYLRGLDGRILWVRSPHAALNTLLQSAGAIVMKVALVIAYKKIKELGLQAMFVANVHDEWQIETLKEHAEQVAKICVDSIVQAGVELRMNCPLAGDYRIGASWGMTH